MLREKRDVRIYFTTHKTRKETGENPGTSKGGVCTGDLSVHIYYYHQMT